MKMIFTDDEIKFLEAMNRLSPEARARIDRLIDSMIKNNEEKKSINNVIPFVKKDLRENEGEL